MSNDINNSNFTGNLTRDAELAYTNSGTAICKFSLAVNEKYGEKEYVNFFDFTIWGKFAESVSQYLTKGIPISVMAKAKQERWEDNDGNKRNKIVFVVQEMRMFGRQQGVVNPDEKTFQENKNSEPLKTASEFEDDIPF